jgi:hypothetical protein
MEFESEFEGKKITITVRKTGSIRSSDPEAFQLFNLIFRDAMAGLKLQNIKRDYFDPRGKVSSWSEASIFTFLTFKCLPHCRLMFPKESWSCDQDTSQAFELTTALS